MRRLIPASFPTPFITHAQIQSLAGAADRTQRQTAKYKELAGALVQAEDVGGLQVRTIPPLSPPFPLPPRLTD